MTFTESVLQSADSGIESADSTTDSAKKSSENQPVGMGLKGKRLTDQSQSMMRC